LRDQALYPSRLKVDTIFSETQRLFFVEKTLTLVSLVSSLKILADVPGVARLLIVTPTFKIQ